MGFIAITVLAALTGAAFGAQEIGRYDFAPGDPAGVAADKSGFDNHGKIVGEAVVADGVLACGGQGFVELPSGEAVFGPRGDRGAVSIRVRPSFAPEELPNEQWEGYSMIFYAMQTDGNGLPDGSQEIGLWCHGPNLYAKYAATGFGAAFALPSPLRKGEWTHLAFCWGPKLKVLYVNGEPVDRDESPNVPVSLDAFPVMIGQHPSSKRWAWRGDLADCRLFDDVLTDDEVAAMARARSLADAPPGTYDPARPWIESVDWGRLWLGTWDMTVNLRLRDNVTRVSAHVEQLGAGPRSGGPVVAATGTPGEALPLKLRVQVATEGPLRLNLVLKDVASKRVIGGRSAFINIPPLSPSLAAASAKTQAAEKLLLPLAGADGDAVRGAVNGELSAVEQATEALSAAVRGEPTRADWDRMIGEAAQLAARADRLLTRTTIYARGVNDGKLPSFGVGADHPLRKYLKDDPFEGVLEAPIELKAARNEYEAAQVLVFALDQDLSGVTVEAADLKGPGAATIPRDSITWNHVGYVKTEKPTYEVRHVGLWPDPLLPPAPFDVAKGSFGIVWLTVRVPPDAAPGDYAGTVTLRPQNASAREVPVRLHVWDFALPRESSLTTAFGLNSMGSFGEKMDVDKYVQNAFEHRISLGFPGSVFAAAKPVFPSFGLAGKTLTFRVRAGGAEGVEVGPLFLICAAEGQAGTRIYGPLPLKRGEWSDAAVELGREEKPTTVRFEYRNAGPIGLTISEMKLDGKVFDAMDRPEWWPAGGPWAAVSKADDGLRFEVGAPAPGEPLIEAWPHIERSAVQTPSDIPFTMDFTEFDARIEKYLGKGINAIFVPVPGCPRDISEAEAKDLVRRNHLGPIAKAYQDHLEQKGWLSSAYTYVADEPEPGSYPALNVVMGTIKQWAPKLRNMLTARSFPPELQYVDIWCPEVYSFNPDSAAAEQAKGKLVWWYPAFSTRHPFPDFWVDYPALDNRVIFWLTWKHKLDGLLYWSITNYWKANPWESAMTFPGANGDGTLVYPGDDGGPVNSLRWECLRDGSEDYEYFVLLRALAQKARGNPQARDLVQQADRLLAIEDSVVRNWREWNADPAALLKARDEMGETIEKLQEVTKG
ncbi:MAG: DUF4091 domain-containing protein [Armatimonadetes bacterium]|nr:DUF4091 domain-containing protein [Armatimonadota bacterium]